jgi:hypothetical protein
MLSAAMALLGACGRSQNVNGIAEYSGAFVYVTDDGGQIREIDLPAGAVRAQIDLPIDGFDPRTSGAGALSDCGSFLVSSATLPGKREGIFAINMRTGSARLLREGLWPTCGPQRHLFFFASQPGKWRISLFDTSIDNPSQTTMMIDGRYSLPPEMVIIEDRYLATMDASASAQVVFEITSVGMNKMWTGGDCAPQFWRSRTGELVCLDPERALRSQKLMKAPGGVLIDMEKAELRGVLHYWPKADAILSTRIRGGWAGREYQDLVAVDLASGKMVTLLRDTNIDITRFTHVKNE